MTELTISLSGVRDDSEYLNITLIDPEGKPFSFLSNYPISRRNRRQSALRKSGWNHRLEERQAYSGQRSATWRLESPYDIEKQAHIANFWPLHN